MELQLDHVPRRASEGLFWGNGRMGALLYVDGPALRIVLDHVDLWESRDPTGGVLKASYGVLRQNAHACFDGNAGLFQPTFPAAQGPCRTRLPGLTVKLPLLGDVDRFHAATDLHLAVSRLSWWTQGARSDAEAWLHAHEDVLEIAYDEHISTYELIGWNLNLPGLAVLRQWGYKPGQAWEGQARHLAQGFGEDRAAVITAWHPPTGKGRLLLTVGTCAAAEAKACAAAQLAALMGFSQRREEALISHRAAWMAYWARCRLEVPDGTLQQAVDVERYKLFCNARETGTPMTLAGVWNDDQRMPPWTGDLHNDMNVQACYAAALRTNQAALMRPYVETYWRALPHFKARAKAFAGVEDGALVPTMMDLSGRGTGTEWNFWNTLLGPELMVATDLCAWWAHTQDKAALAERVVPFVTAVVRLYEAIAEKGPDGRVHFPLTHSPEVTDGGRIVFGEDAAFVVSALRHVTAALVAGLETLGRTEEAARWRRFLAKLPEMPTGPQGIQVLRGWDLRESHRHFTHLYAMFPLGDLDRARDGDRALMERSLDHVVALGTAGYAAWSFPYLAILATRAGRGDMAGRLLDIYLRSFRTANTFTVNGDHLKTGVIAPADEMAGEAADAFTLEAGLLVPAAVAEMLVHRAGDTVWLLPGVPAEWRDAFAESVVVPGGHRVHVCMSGGVLAAATIVPGRDEQVLVACDRVGEAYEVVCGEETTRVTAHVLRHVVALKRGCAVTLVRVD